MLAPFEVDDPRLLRPLCVAINAGSLSAKEPTITAGPFRRGDSLPVEIDPLVYGKGLFLDGLYPVEALTGVTQTFPLPMITGHYIEDACIVIKNGVYLGFELNISRYGDQQIRRYHRVWYLNFKNHYELGTSFTHDLRWSEEVYKAWLADPNTVLARTLSTKEGREKLAQAMVQPIRHSIYRRVTPGLIDLPGNPTIQPVTPTSGLFLMEQVTRQPLPLPPPSRIALQEEEDRLVFEALEALARDGLDA